METNTVSKAFVFLMVALAFNGFVLNSYATDFDNGLKEFREENYEEALPWFLDARKKEPGSSSIAFFLGLTYKSMEKYGEAIPYLKDAITLTPHIKEALVELADALYQTGDLDSAKKWIELGEQQGLLTSRLQFLKGLVLLKAGENEKAIEELETAKLLDEKLAQAADFHMATAYAQAGQLVEALECFKAATTLDPTSEIGTYAKEYERGLADKLERERPLQFNIGFGYKYDSNLVAKPISGPVADVITNQKDSAITCSLGGSYTAPFSFQGPFFFSAQYSVNVDEYFHKTNDSVTQVLTLVPGYSFSRIFLRVPILYAHSRFNEAEYVQITGLSPLARIALGRNSALEISLAYQKKDYLQELQSGISDDDEDRDGDVLSLSAGYTLLPGEESLLGLWYTFSDENTDGVNWSYRDNKLSLSLVYPLFESLKLLISGEMDFIRYQNVHTIFELKRRDELYTGSAMLSYEIDGNTRIYANYNYTINNSNMPDFYEYKRDVYSTGIEYRF